MQASPVLWLLMALVGIGVGMHRGLVASIREHHLKMLVIPAGVVIGSLVGGALAALPLGFTVQEGMAAASGLGWYSLAGVTIENAAGAELGGIAFLANLMRELLSFFCIPWIARHLNGYACIAAGAATSEDTTLPMMIRYTDERCVVYSPHQRRHLLGMRAGAHRPLPGLAHPRRRGYTGGYIAAHIASPFAGAPVQYRAQCTRKCAAEERDGPGSTLRGGNVRPATCGSADRTFAGSLPGSLPREMSRGPGKTRGNVRANVRWGPRDR